MIKNINTYGDMMAESAIVNEKNQNGYEMRSDLLAA
jgi:hypothetical protein